MDVKRAINTITDQGLKIQDLEAKIEINQEYLERIKNHVRIYILIAFWTGFFTGKIL